MTDLLGMQPPVTIPFDRSLRPETTYLVFDNLNNYGPIDIRVADNYTGNQPSQVWFPRSTVSQIQGSFPTLLRMILACTCMPSCAGNVH